MRRIVKIHGLKLLKAFLEDLKEDLATPRPEPEFPFDRMFDSVTKDGWLKEMGRNEIERPRHPELSETALDRLAYQHYKKTCKQPIITNFDKRTEYCRSLTNQELRGIGIDMSTVPEGLYAYQVDACCITEAYLTGKRGTVKAAIVSLAPGMGKTIISITAGKMAKCPYPWIIVAPKSLLLLWAGESKRFMVDQPRIVTYSRSGPQPENFQDADIVLVTYETLQREWSALKGFSLYMDYRRRHRHPMRATPVKKKGCKYIPHNTRRAKAPLFQTNWGLSIFDEAQMMRTNDKDTSSACHALASYAVCKILLSGTLMMSQYNELRSYLACIGLNAYNVMKWFRSHFLNKRKGNDENLQRKYRSSETPPLEAMRTAMLYLVFQSQGLIINRFMKYEGKLMREGVADFVQEKPIEVYLDDGTKYGNTFKYGMKTAVVHVS